MTLAEKHCVAVPTGASPLSREKAAWWAREIPHWLLEEAQLTREWKLADFAQAMAFANRVAAIAAQENHHPEICISFRVVRLTLTTHAVNGLSLNDFILAAKIDRMEAEGWPNRSAA